MANDVVVSAGLAAAGADVLLTDLDCPGALDVLDEVKTWQTRPLDAVYPIIYIDALVVKVRDGGTVQNRSAYLAIGRVPLRFLLPLLAGAAVSAPLVIGLLRPYQVEGYAWMTRLLSWAGGAVLADDMGLGKTIQIISLLLQARSAAGATGSPAWRRRSPAGNRRSLLDP